MYSLIKPQPENLIDDETALLLDSGETVVVSVIPTIAPNNTSVVFTGKARCLETGAEVSFTQKVPSHIVLEMTAETITKNIILALIGEPAPNTFSPAFIESVNLKRAIALKKSLNKIAINPGKALGLIK